MAKIKIDFTVEYPGLTDEEAEALRWQIRQFIQPDMVMRICATRFKDHEKYIHSSKLEVNGMVTVEKEPVHTMADTIAEVKELEKK